MSFSCRLAPLLDTHQKLSFLLHDEVFGILVRQTQSPFPPTKSLEARNCWWCSIVGSVLPE